MILVRSLRLTPGEKETKLTALAARRLRVAPGAVREMKIVKKSLDARKKSDIHWTYTVAVAVADEDAVLSRTPQAERYAPVQYEIPRAESDERPVVAGFGPAGMFAALVLAEAGLRPIVLERGRDVDERSADVERFWRTGALSRSSNVQFGEGGAGTFSDGKLNTGTHDVRIGWVLERFRDFGAPESVTYDAKPHVGTDKLKTVVKNLRQRVIALGGEVRFAEQLTALHGENGVLTGCTVMTETGPYELRCSDLILAPGHSARDTFAMLHEMALPMEQKPIAVGVRIEHRQAKISEAQYGDAWRALPPASYKLSCHLPSGRGVFSFCVCPGGQVVAAASDYGQVVTNGMSYSGRAGENINGGLLVSVGPEDYPGDDPLAGVRFQETWERAAWDYGTAGHPPVYEAASAVFHAPAQLVGDFLTGQPSAGPRSVTPTYRPGVRWGTLDAVLPGSVLSALKEALPILDGKLRGFADPDAVLTGVETRSSSPVRILRGDDLQSAGLRGLYPCGEGAGYAGGITSAAVDGMRCAEAICARYRYGTNDE